MNNTGSDSEHNQLELLLDQLLKNSPPQLADIIRLGAMPHWLDRDVAAVLYPEEPDSALDALQQFRFVMPVAPDQLTYHSQVRAYLLETWLTNDRLRSRFRQISARLAEHYQARASQTSDTSQAVLPEWIYHLLAANPNWGIAQLGRLFERLVEARELGTAERLAAVAEERRPLLGEQTPWLNYYPARLALAHYDVQAAMEGFSTLAEDGHDAALTAAAQRGLGWTLVREQQWAKGIKQLKRSLQVFEKLHDSENIVQTQLTLGDAYRDLADRSGGIYEESQEFSGHLHYAAYVISHFPFLIYRRLAEHLDFLPPLLGFDYQNWIVARLLHLAAQAYRKAERANSQLNDDRLRVEIQQRLAEINLELGKYQISEREYRDLLKTFLVRSSSYRTARAHLGLARIALRRDDHSTAQQQFEASLETFKHYEDWQHVGEAAHHLGQLFQAEGNISAALGVYTTGIEATTRSQDWPRRTEIVASLRKLMTADDLSLINEAQREQVKSALGQVDRLTYIARFPGQIHRLFTGFAQILAVLGVVSTGLIALVLAFLLGYTFIIVEGQIRNLTSSAPVSPALTNAIILLLDAFVPLFVLWAYYLLYVPIGWFIVRFLVPISRVEESQPETYVLNETQIAQYDGEGRPLSTITWNNVDLVIIADRCVWQHPSALFSKTLITGSDQPLVIRGTTNHYRELQQEIEVYRVRHQPNPRPPVQCGLSIVNHWWLWGALVFALSLATILVFGIGVSSQFCATPYVNGVCPNPIRLVLASWAMWTNIFFVLLFTVGSVVRLINAWLCVRRSLRQTGA
jgi:hypothetical protein